jgi:Rad51
MLVKALPSPMRLPFNMRNIDELLSGFEVGDFAVLHGTTAVLPLSLLLCVRAQLPPQLGGLGTDVVFVDGGNTFRLYNISRLAQIHQIDSQNVLERIHIARAFTAYQLASLLMDKMAVTVERLRARLVIVSDIAGLFLDKDIPDEEARRVFSHVTGYLSKFATENGVVLVATYLPRKASQRNLYLHTLTCSRANVVASVRQGKHGREFVLEKHPRLLLGYAEFPSKNVRLTEFVGVNS